MINAPPTANLSVRGISLNVGALQWIVPFEDINPILWLDLFENILASSGIQATQHNFELGLPECYFLRVTRTRTDIEMSACDRALESFGHSAETNLAGLGRFIVDLLQAAVLNHTMQTRLQRLLRWAHAIDNSIQYEAFIPLPVENKQSRFKCQDSRPPLPIDNLHHIAYHAVWSDELSADLEGRIDGRLIYIDQVDGVRVRRIDSGHTVRFLEGHSMPDHGNAVITISPRNCLTRHSNAGATLWTVPSPFTTPIRWAYQYHDDVLVADDSGKLSCFSQTDGTSLWNYEVFRGPTSRPFFTQRHVWVCGDDRFVHQLGRIRGEPCAYHPISGHQPLAEATSSEHYVLAEAGVGRRHSVVRCFRDGQTEEHWQRAVAGLVTDMVGVPEKRLHCLIDTESGFRLLTMSLVDGSILGDAHTGLKKDGVRLCPVGDFVFLKSLDGGVIALDAVSANPMWRLAADDTEHTATSIPTPAFVRGLILTPGATLRAIHPSTGDVLQIIHHDTLHPKDLVVVDHSQLLVSDGRIVTSYRLGGHLASVPVG